MAMIAYDPMMLCVEKNPECAGLLHKDDLVRSYLMYHPAPVAPPFSLRETLAVADGFINHHISLSDHHGFE